MAKLEGAIAITGLPPHRGLILSFAFFRVATADAPAPYGGDPPAEAATDAHPVAEQVDFDNESVQPAYDLPFEVERPAGFYYLQVRAVLFRLRTGQVFAQAEQFFFGRRPLAFVEDAVGRVTVPVEWPPQAPDELHTYFTVEPGQ